MLRRDVLLRRWSVLVAVMSAAALAVVAQNHAPWTLESVLHQLDTEAKSFHSLSADVERTKVTVVVNDRSTESGQILVHGDKMRIDLTSPSARTILRNGETLWVYTPGLKRVEEYNLSRHREMVDQFLRLGFGTPGNELEKGYVVTLLGETTLDNKKVLQLELTPRSEPVRNQISKIQLWIDESSWLPVQQQLFETGSQDYLVIRYANIVRNPKIHDSRFKPHWPHGTQKLKPQV
jgi:outer membrane lipoprotein-sorting protein